MNEYWKQTEYSYKSSQLSNNNLRNVCMFYQEEMSIWICVNTAETRLRKKKERKDKKNTSKKTTMTTYTSKQRL